MPPNNPSNPMPTRSGPTTTSPQAAAINSSALPALPEEDTAELIALNRLPPLPPAHAQELRQLAQPCDESDWGRFLPPAIDPYGDCMGAGMDCVVGCSSRTAAFAMLFALLDSGL